MKKRERVVRGGGAGGKPEDTTATAADGGKKKRKKKSKPTEDAAGDAPPPYEGPAADEGGKKKKRKKKSGGEAATEPATTTAPATGDGGEGGKKKRKKKSKGGDESAAPAADTAAPAEAEGKKKRKKKSKDGDAPAEDAPAGGEPGKKKRKKKSAPPADENDSTAANTDTAPADGKKKRKKKGGDADVVDDSGSKDKKKKKKPAQRQLESDFDETDDDKPSKSAGKKGKNGDEDSYTYEYELVRTEEVDDGGADRGGAPGRGRRKRGVRGPPPGRRGPRRVMGRRPPPPHAPVDRKLTNIERSLHDLEARLANQQRDLAVQNNYVEQEVHALERRLDHHHSHPHSTFLRSDYSDEYVPRYPACRHHHHQCCCVSSARQHHAPRSRRGSMSGVSVVTGLSDSYSGSVYELVKVRDGHPNHYSLSHGHNHSKQPRRRGGEPDWSPNLSAESDFSEHGRGRGEFRIQGELSHSGSVDEFANYDIPRIIDHEPDYTLTERPDDPFLQELNARADDYSSFDEDAMRVAPDQSLRSAAPGYHSDFADFNDEPPPTHAAAYKGDYADFEESAPPPFYDNDFAPFDRSNASQFTNKGYKSDYVESEDEPPGHVYDNDFARFTESRFNIAEEGDYYHDFVLFNPPPAPDSSSSSVEVVTSSSDYRHDYTHYQEGYDTDFADFDPRKKKYRRRIKPKDTAATADERLRALDEQMEQFNDYLQRMGGGATSGGGVSGYESELNRLEVRLADLQRHAGDVIESYSPSYTYSVYSFPSYSYSIERVIRRPHHRHGHHGRHGHYVYSHGHTHSRPHSVVVSRRSVSPNEYYTQAPPVIEYSVYSYSLEGDDLPAKPHQLTGPRRLAELQSKYRDLEARLDDATRRYSEQARYLEKRLEDAEDQAQYVEKNVADLGYRLDDAMKTASRDDHKAKKGKKKKGKSKNKRKQRA